MSASGGTFQLNSEVQLIGLELLRTAAEPGPLQFAADLTQAIVLIPRPGKFRGICHALRHEQRAQLGREHHPLGYDMHPGHSR